MRLGFLVTLIGIMPVLMAIGPQSGELLRQTAIVPGVGLLLVAFGYAMVERDRS